MTTFTSPTTAVAGARTTTRRTLSAAALAAYERDGYYIGRQLFGAAEAAQIRHAFMAAAAPGPVSGLSDTQFQLKDGIAYDSTDPLARYPRMFHPHRHPELLVGQLAQKYMLDARVGAILADLLDEEPIAAQSMFYFKPPGARGQALHQDNFYLKVNPGSCMAAWTAIDDADEENGTLVVVPGSHKLDLLCPGEADTRVSFTSVKVKVPAGMQEVAVHLKAGDVLFFNGSLIHGSYPNRSKERFRCSLICHYMPQSGVEVAQFYKPLFSFAGEVVERKVALGGGPCGAAEAKGAH